MQQLSFFDFELGDETEVLPSRHHLDFYESPSWFGTELLKYVDVSGTVLEPCVGGGAIARVLTLSSNIQKIITNDIDPNKQADYHFDATVGKSWNKFPSFDWAVTNPPYGDKAAPIVINAFNQAKVGIAMFLLGGFMEVCEDRVDFLDKYPPSQIIFLPRFCFRKDKTGKRWTTDNQSINCFVWNKQDMGKGTKITMRSPQKIAGFYKNPDKAISWSEVYKIASDLF